MLLQVGYICCHASGSEWPTICQTAELMTVFQNKNWANGDSAFECLGAAEMRGRFIVRITL